jgi:two-component system sensor histidine kinase VanS
MTHPTPARLADLVESVPATHLTLAQAHAQRIEVAVGGDAVVTLDQTLFKRALSNVVANALQNTPDGGRVRIAAAAGRGRGEGAGGQEAGRQDAHTQEGEPPAQDRVRLSGLNEGAPIPDEVLHRLFEPFYRTDEARSSAHRRSGLGLALVEKALSQMGIPFALENTSQGVLFWMDLPRTGEGAGEEADGQADERTGE